MLDRRLVGLLADALHVELEKDVAHGGVRRHHDLVDRLAAEPQTGAAVHDGAADGGRRGLLQLARLVVPVVGDAVHHVAAAKGLRVLEGRAVHALAALQIDEVEHHRRRAEIDRETQHVAAVAVHHGAVVEHVVAPPPDEGVEGLGRAGRVRMRAHQDARGGGGAARRQRRCRRVRPAPGRRGGREAVGSPRPPCARTARSRPRSPRPRIRGSGRCAGTRSAPRRQARRRSRTASCRWRAARSCRRGRPCRARPAALRLRAAPRHSA